MVVAYHLGFGWAKGGYLGVDVFFVISGFLISGMLQNEFRQSGKVDLVNFWARRARRLMPAATLVALATLSWIALAPGPFRQIYRAKTGLAVAAYLSNLFFLHRGADYFGPAARQDPLLHTWSLAVEEQFYIFYAPIATLLFAFSYRAIRNRDLAIASAVILVTMTSVAWFVFLSVNAPMTAFYTIGARVWEFGIGALVAFLGFPTRATQSVIRRPISVAAFIGLLFCAGIANSASAPAPAVTIALVACVASIIATGGTAPKTLSDKVLEARWLGVIGTLSYSWYLWHWPVSIAMLDWMPSLTSAHAPAILVLSLTLSMLTYVLVERPLRASAWLAARPRRSLGLAVGSSCLIALASILVITHARSRLSAPELKEVRVARALFPEAENDKCGFGNATHQLVCEYGPSSADTVVAVFGDSHAAQWLPALRTASRWKILSFIRSSCPSVPVTVRDLATDGVFKSCDTWREQALLQIVKTRPSVVLISNFHRYELVDSKGTIRMGPTQATSVASWTNGMTRTLSTFRAAGIASVVVRDTPFPESDLLDCLASGEMAATCSSPRTVALDSTFAASEKNLAAQLSAGFIDMSAFICARQECPAGTLKMPIYRDQHHLSVHFAELLGPSFNERLRLFMRAEASRKEMSRPSGVRSAGDTVPLVTLRSAPW